jgi:hypothetical protein
MAVSFRCTVKAALPAALPACSSLWHRSDGVLHISIFLFALDAEPLPVWDGSVGRRTLRQTAEQVGAAPTELCEQFALFLDRARFV